MPADPGGDGVSGVAEYCCPICLQPVCERSYTEPCFHLFCAACILQWLARSARCPLCNGSVSAVVQQHAETGRVSRTAVGHLDASSNSRNTNWRQQGRNAYGLDPRLAQAHGVLGMRKREAVYAHGLRRVAPACEPARVRVSQTPQLLREEIGRPRCRAWIRRDLQAALGVEDVHIVESLVVALARDAGSLALDGPPLHSLACLLGPSTSLFLQELAAFVDSTLDMHSYDMHVAYGTRQPN
ncbi:hypothetical protein H4R18_001010 [Coemansia javaensis]|uniref:RING-type E3 ubiquitin transferase n=1 Tax=Coemansia javaensis TaxID=2761396 RepID=A0A9W8LKW3_9FUNG|nr:hypothetical protein H4R18_001010 [Coemansia javaensis]